MGRAAPFGSLLTITLVACGDRSSNAPVEAGELDPQAWFREEAHERGLVFVHRTGHREAFLFPELMGGGVALFDMDGDGDLDAFLVQSGSLEEETEPVQHGLFENRGNGTFGDVSALSGVQVKGYGMGVAAGDYDGDGDVDLYVTNVGPNVLLANDGRGRFRDVTAAAGVGDAGWGTSACFFDMEADGDLDLFVVNYLGWSRALERPCFGPTGQPDYCGPSVYAAPTPDVLYRNEGDGTFRDVSEAAGLRAAWGNGLGVVPGDFDGNGTLDLFVANDLTPDQLWLNQGDGTFQDGASLAGVAVDAFGRPRAGMGVDAADIDDDLDLDLIVVHMAGEKDGLFRNLGDYFVEETTRLGVGPALQRLTRFGVGFHDFDADGRLDIFIGNGRVNLLMEPLVAVDPYAEPNALLRGTAEGRWAAVEPPGGTLERLLFTSRGAAFGDVDGDGAIDILVGNRDAPASLYHNVFPAPGRQLVTRLVDERGRDALGASAAFRVGERTLRRDVKPGYSYCSASDPRLYVGLGSAERVDEVRVRWVDGTGELFGPLEAGGVVTLRRGEGRMP